MSKTSSANIQINTANLQSEVECDHELVFKTIKSILTSGGVKRGEVSVALVSDKECGDLNSRFLGREGTTDVIAFTYTKKDDGDYLEGEIVVNAAEALRKSEMVAHDAITELLLYVAHGALHLLGWEDENEGLRIAMNTHAAEMLLRCGVEVDVSSL